MKEWLDLRWIGCVKESKSSSVWASIGKGEWGRVILVEK